MNWIINKLKGLFWSSIFSATVMIVLSFFPQARERMAHLIKVLKDRQTAASQPVSEANAYADAQAAMPIEEPGSQLPKLNLSEGDPANDSQSTLGGLADQASDALRELTGRPARKGVSSSLNEYKINDQSYVYINGKYYKARADNTYLINGEKVYFIDNGRRNPSSRGESATKSSTTNYAPQEKSNLNPDQLPLTPNEMIESYKKVQDNIRKRNEELDKLEYNR